MHKLNIMKNILKSLSFGILAIVLISLCSCEDDAGFSPVVGCEEFAVEIEGMEYDSLLTAIVTNGTEPFEYSWSTGDTVQSIGILFEDASVTVTDSEGCTAVATVNINIEQDPCDSFNATITIDSSTVVIYAIPTSGTSPYSYLWNDGSNDSELDIDPNVPGTYTVTITDSNGCTALGNYEVSSNDPCLGFSTEVFSVQDSTGVKTIIYTNPNGGTMPFAYIWSQGSATKEITTTETTGTFSVTVTDDNGCTATDEIEL